VRKRKETSPEKLSWWRSLTKWLIVLIVAPVIVAIILLIVSPRITRWANKQKAESITPEIEVKLRSVLITRGLEDKVFELKTGLHILNKEDEDYSIKLLKLKNLHSNDSLSLIDNEPILIPKAKQVDEQIEMTTAHFSRLFEYLPSPLRSRWEVTYKIAPSEKIMSSIADSSTIDCLHFYLLPLKFMQEVRYDSNFQVIWNFEEALDTRGGGSRTVGWDTVAFYFYPKDFIRVRMDTNLDKVADKIVRADSLQYHVKKLTEGKFLDVSVDYEGLKQNVSGIIIGKVEINNLLSHEYFGMMRFNPDSYKKLVEVLEDCADNSIPLSRSSAEFIFWRFQTE